MESLAEGRGETWLQASSNLPQIRVAARLRDHGATVASLTTLSLPSAPSAFVLCVVQNRELLGALLGHAVTATETVAIPGLSGTFLVQLFSPVAEPLGQLVPPQPGTKVFFCNSLRYKCYLKSGFTLKAKPKAHPQLGQGPQGAASEEFYLTG